MNGPKRRCSWCNSPIPRGSRSTRRFCSTSCRVRLWHDRNPSQPPDPRLEQLYGPANPKHYHVRHGATVLVGHRKNRPWFGSACPPECPGLSEGEQYRPMEEFWRVEDTDATQAAEVRR